MPDYHYTQENLKNMAKKKFWSPEMVNDYRDRVFANTAAHKCELKSSCSSVRRLSQTKPQHEVRSGGHKVPAYELWAMDSCWKGENHS